MVFNHVKTGANKFYVIEIIGKKLRLVARFEIYLNTQQQTRSPNIRYTRHIGELSSFTSHFKIKVGLFVCLYF